MCYVHTYTHNRILTIKMNEIMQFSVTWMDLEITILSEVSQTKTDVTWYHLYVESEKLIQTNLLIKQKQTHKHRKQTWRSKGKGGRNKSGAGEWQIHTIVHKINNKDLGYSTENYVQFPVITYDGKGSKKEFTVLYPWN